VGILRWLEAKIFFGNVIHDYGVIDESGFGFGRVRISVLLCRRGDRTNLVIKESAIAWLGFSVRYTMLGRGSLIGLKRAVDDALLQAG
jgi:hypothetical protein